MQILASSNKPIHEWDAPSLVETSENRVEIMEIKGLTTERKNIVLEGEDMNDMVTQVVDAIIKEGVLG
jgi:hypothetical protein